MKSSAFDLCLRIYLNVNGVLTKRGRERKPRGGQRQRASVTEKRWERKRWLAALFNTALNWIADQAISYSHSVNSIKWGKKRERNSIIATICTIHSQTDTPKQTRIVWLNHFIDRRYRRRRCFQSLFFASIGQALDWKLQWPTLMQSTKMFKMKSLYHHQICQNLSRSLSEALEIWRCMYLHERNFL